MLSLPSSVRIFVCREPADMRRSFDGLSAMVRDVIAADPMCGHLFCFFNKKRDRCKVLWWNRTGYWLLYTRLEKGRFSLASIDQQCDVSPEVTSSELSLILDGIDLHGARRRARYDDRRSSRKTTLVR